MTDFNINKYVFSFYVITIILFSGCSDDSSSSNSSQSARQKELIDPHYIGRSSCVECHAKESELFRNSHHDLAMQEVTDQSMLGNFDNATFAYNEITSTFFKKGKTYFVNTDGPDGKSIDYEIKFTFGVDPL